MITHFIFTLVMEQSTAQHAVSILFVKQYGTIYVASRVPRGRIGARAQSGGRSLSSVYHEITTARIHLSGRLLRIGTLIPGQFCHEDCSVCTLTAEECANGVCTAAQGTQCADLGGQHLES